MQKQNIGSAALASTISDQGYCRQNQSFVPSLFHWQTVTKMAIFFNRIKSFCFASNRCKPNIGGLFRTSQIEKVLAKIFAPIIISVNSAPAHNNNNTASGFFRQRGLTCESDYGSKALSISRMLGASRASAGVLFPPALGLVEYR
ncbi:MAG: hypothetical protein IPI97_15450 [Nitrosomonas sp.]|nr:hypothetical protein [Nitrosomonas sp.]